MPINKFPHRISAYTVDVTTDVQIDGAITNVDYIQWDLTADPAHSEGQEHWNGDDGTKEIDLPGGNVNLQVGLENLIRVKAGEDILNGQLVYPSGADGVNMIVSLADNTAYLTSLVAGIATEDISSGQQGYITTFGLVRDLNTGAFNDGDFLWLGTSGNWSNVRPTAGTAELHVLTGYVKRSHATEGEIFITTVFVPRMRYLSDNTLIGSMADGEIWTWIAANSRHENRQLTYRTATDIDNTDSPYAQLVTDQIINCDTASGNITLNLLAIASAASQLIMITCVGANDVILTPDGSETIHGAATMLLTDGDSVILYPFSATDWRAR